ncbi:hypothetical protein [Kribbella sp. NPDC050459]|uniref:hypothetical protein n=1 Tax=Kribbella sp. NPDC050459 TaxID=3155785 RepID=UPI0033D81989
MRAAPTYGSSRPTSPTWCGRLNSSRESWWGWLADPSRWHSVEVRRWAAADRELLDGVLGPAAVREVTDALASGGATAGVPLEVAPAAVWRRLAVIDALDWCPVS